MGAIAIRQPQPPSLHDWLPEKHLARFLVDVVDALDLGAIYEAKKEIPV